MANDPEAAAVSITTTVAVAPLVRFPIAQVIGLAVVTHVPTLGVAETNVIPVASVSESETVFAVDVPLFVIVIV